MRFDRLAPLLLLALAPACAHRDAPLTDTASPLHVERFGGRPGSARTLIVVLHGDTAETGPDVAYRAARAYADAVPNSVAIAVLRPGFDDAEGHRSAGTQASAGSLALDRLKSVAATIRLAQQRSPNARTLLVGQGDGAALAANLAGTQPRIADAMVLAGCPCMLDEWRAYQAERTGAADPATQDKLDPLKTVGGVPATLQATMLVGSKDKDALPRFSRGYAEALALRGVATDFRILTDKGHALLQEPEVLAAVQQLAATGARPR